MNTNPQAKRILCYGDSNTWGDVPNKEERYASNIRWTGVLQDALGDGYEVVEEGLGGRTFEAVESGKEHRVGITHLTSILKTHEPIDIMTIMLGTNDMKSNFSLSVEDIAEHLKRTIQLVKEETPNTKIVVISPPPVTNPDGRELDERLKDAPEQSILLEPLYKEVAQEMDCLYLNAGEFISLENTDGYHLAEEHHKLLGEKLAELLQNRF